MVRLVGTIAIALLINAVSFLSAQAPPGGNVSGNISAAVTAPASIECSAGFSSSIALTGFDIQDPGQAEVMLVLDESGSISSSDFQRERDFAVSVINSLMVNAGLTRMGIVQFDDDARLTLPLNANRQSVINAAGNMSQRRGSTCIGCGIQLATQHLVTAGRPQTTRFMIVLTDGLNNVQTSTFNQVVTQAKNNGILLLAIGVGSSVDQNQIEFIASDIPGKDMSFLINDFAQLPTLVTTLTATLARPGATNVIVNVDVMPRFPAATATATAGQVQVNPTSVVWTLPSLGAAARTLTLNHQHDGQGNGPLQIFNATYSDAEGHLVEIAVPSTAVSGCNTPPVANAGVDIEEALSGSATRTIVLNGGSSTDDGLISPLTYSWASDVGGFTASGPTPAFLLPFGVYNFTLTVSDGEFTDTDDVTVAVVDPTPPVITASVAGTPGNDGWFRSNADVTFTASDPETGIASSSGCGTTTVAVDTPGQLVTCTATNGAGESASDSETVKRDATAPTLTVSSPVTAEATSGAGAVVTYAAPIAEDPTSGVAAVSCAPAAATLFGLGTTAVACSASDHAGNSTTAGFTVTVGDTTAPVIVDVSPSPSSLPRVNHKMVDVTITAGATDTVSAATCRITGASSSEPDNGLGDGDTANDIVITGPLSLQLRGERGGNGPGRTYTIEITCTDASGNSATQSTTVTVAHSSR